VNVALNIAHQMFSVRPDYNKLGMLRRDFPGVPLMALTATANGKVVNDAIHALGMANEYRFVTSFNRPNLRYQVLEKDSKTIEAIAAYISKRSSDSGVIYCLSRKDCEKLAEKLTTKVQGARVSFYHAELDAHERERRHREWSHGRISVLCATIAFGMGIDKPDVRYVIHYSMPKSITHYYQESGRAGRDCENADCILYYTYKDKKILENMIIKSSNEPYGPATRRKIEQLYTCVRYCEDEFRCRRTMQLEFFGETFDSRKCNKTCDNCRAARVPDRRDLTSIAQEILRLLDSMAKKKRVTMTQLTDLYRGSKSQSATKGLDTSALDGYGRGSKLKKIELDKIVHAMVCDHILVETSIQTQSGYKIDYIEAAENAGRVLNGQHKFYVNFPTPHQNGKEEQTTAKKRKANNSKGSKPSKSNVTGVAPEEIGVNVPMELDESDNEDSSSILMPRAEDTVRPLIPPRKSTELAQRIKELAEAWAREEAMLGSKSVFYWNIMSNHAMKAISSAVPTTIAELSEVGVLGAEILKNYGERLVRVVAAFVEREDLGSQVAMTKASKRPRMEAEAPIVEKAKVSNPTGTRSGIPGNDVVASKYFGKP
jgi:bloom syndrome protein